ncbi:MAG: DUF1211 domain-containing protein [Rhodanobacter denitrificans]|uniref:DUF1211 domain-containing protein n=1 Tax=Rhodanobacter denitrificans TaxID=666685 RepID=A0A2W5KNK3_9GAMM|nr:MAG: DUF1211 domain-containing protein [Rhodanobacter denitrificans]
MIRSRSGGAAAAARHEDGFLQRGAEVTRIEAFVDAAFAFAITLMVISIDEIPDSIDALKLALKAIPSYAASFLLIALFWRGHADWSRRYGLDDRQSQRLSLLLVFLVLIFIYPLRMVFDALFSWVSSGWLPAKFSLSTLSDLRLMFAVFALAFGSMGLVSCLLYVHAWRQRERIGLDALERDLTRYAMLRWAVIPLFSLISLALTTWLPVIPGVPWSVALPGCIFFGLHLVQLLMPIQHRRILARHGPIAP